jgi:hypothetical protein
MNKLSCFIIIIITCGFCSGQNLVPNPSFEDTVHCPSTLTQIDAAAGWSSANAIGTPDYYNTCASDPGLTPPATYFNYQNPLTGNAYAGIVTVYFPGTNPDPREYIGAQLNNSLQTGTKYFVSFYVSRAYAIAQHYILATNKFGVLFSTVAYSVTNPAPENNFAHVYTDSIITDTLNWIQVKGSFVADSAYQYINIGNFFDNANTDTLNFGDTLAHSAYYLIDNVCVSTDSLTCYSLVGVIEIKNESEISLSPNPFSNTLTITSKINQPLEITLYDITSRKLLHQQFTNSTSINTSHLSKGIYIYELRNKNSVIKKGKVVKN